MHLFRHIIIITCCMALSGCYAINQQHYEEIINIQSNLERLRAQDARLEADIAALKQLGSDIESELSAEIGDQQATVEYLGNNAFGVALSEPLLFYTGSVDVNKSGTALLGKLAAALKKSPEGAIIRIVGHTDAIPVKVRPGQRFIDNWELSAARAASIARVLIWSKQLDPSHIRIEGRASTDPVAGNDEVAERAKNRRVEIFIELPANQ